MEEIIKSVEKDIIKFEELLEWMRSYSWERHSCGRGGDVEMEKVKELAREVIKSLVNYI